MINRVALRCALVLALAGVWLLGRAAAGQESGVLGARPEERQAPVWTTSSATQKQPIEQKAAGDGLAKDAKPKASPKASLAVLLARVIANESTRVLRPTHDGGGTAGELDADARAIWQTVLAFARWKGVSPERAIRRLAPHVTGTKAPKRARHALYATLPARGGERPALWIDAEHGPWATYGRNWVKLRANVAALVAGAAPRPCAADLVVAWGCDAGPQCNDVPIAMARGLVAVDCGDTRNRFFALPSSRVLDAEVARGGTPCRTAYQSAPLVFEQGAN